MIFNLQFPPAVLVTSIQLRCLAWGSRVTPAFSMQELSQITGKSKATLYMRLSQLKSLTSLQWRSIGRGKMIVSFPEEPADMSEQKAVPPNIPNSTILNSKNSELPDPASYFPHRILGYLSYQEDQYGFPNKKGSHA
jgi:predicted DNA-binding transcriptional regulator AlpA